MSSQAQPEIGLSQSTLYFPTGAVTDPAAKVENILLLTNQSAEPFIWKMRRSPKSPFVVHPTSGVLHPREERRVSISCAASALPDISQSTTERLQVLARFFHETDNRDKVAECWANQTAEAAMARLKLDLPVVFTDQPPATMVRHLRSVSRGADAASAATATAAVSAVTPQRQDVAGGADRTPASNVAVSQSPARFDPAAPSPSPAPRTAAAASNTITTTTTTTTTAKKLESVAPTPTPSMPATPSSSVANKKPPVTPAAASQPAAVASVSVAAKPQSAAASPMASPIVSAPTAPVAKKQSIIQKALFFAIPIYVFFPLLIMAFIVGIKLGGPNPTGGGAAAKGTGDL